METDRHYFLEGLFVIGLAAAAVAFFLWLAGSAQRDQVLYRIRFAESVSGLSRGDPVKFHGVDVGTVRTLSIDARDPRLVQVDVMLAKDAPVKTDTKASLRLKGLTGVVFVELGGGAPDARALRDVTPQDQVPEIPSEKSPLTSVLDQLPKIVDQLPKVVEKFSGLEDKAHKVLSDVGEVTQKVKENPSILLRPPKKKDGEDKPAEPGRNQRQP